MPYAGILTLWDVAEKTDTLVIACSRCDRAGRYPVATLIEKHGPHHTIPAVLRTLAADCRKFTSLAAIYDTCGLHCPELPKIFMQQVRSGSGDLASLRPPRR